MIPCEQCDQAIYQHEGHICIECDMEMSEKECTNNQGLCNDCRYKVDGRADK